jgi:uncharacterized protein (TIGR02246 family)
VSRLIAIALAGLAALVPAFAGPAEDAAAVIDRWSAAYSANDPAALVALYTPDAVLLGTMSPIMSVGTAGIAAYFKRLTSSRNKNRIVEKRMLVLGDGAVLSYGFYDFVIAGSPDRRPARFTMLLVKRGGAWLIAHHHSSPRVDPPRK